MNNNKDVKFDFTNNHMLVEVSELKFLPATAVFEFNNQRLYKTIRIIVKKLKRYFNEKLVVNCMCLIDNCECVDNSKSIIVC